MPGKVKTRSEDDEDPTVEDDEIEVDADEDEDDEDGTGGKDDGDENDDDAPPTKDDGSPVTAKDWAALQDALKNARKAERAAKRAKGKPATDPDEAAKAAEAKYKPMLVKQAARGALLEAGLVVAKGKESAAVARALKLLDMDEIDLSEDGDVEGLEEQIEELKDEFPHLFARKSSRRVDGAERGRPAGRKESSADALASLIS